MTRSNNKVLKIRTAKLDDTGTFACRGVNGFGKAQVNIHLIVVGKFTFELEIHCEKESTRVVDFGMKVPKVGFQIRDYSPSRLDDIRKSKSSF